MSDETEHCRGLFVVANIFCTNERRDRKVLRHGLQVYPIPQFELVPLVA